MPEEHDIERLKALETTLDLFADLNSLRGEDFFLGLASATAVLLLKRTLSGHAEDGMRHYIELLQNTLPALASVDAENPAKAQPTHADGHA